MALQENIRTIPNLLSLARIVAAPGLCLLVVHCHYTAALAIFVLAGISDMVCVRMCTCVGRGEGKVTLTHPLPFDRRTATLPAHSLSRPLPLALCWTPWQTSSWSACSFWHSPPLATCHVRLAYCPPPPRTAPPSLPPPRYMQCYPQVWFWAGTSSWFWGDSTSASPLCLPRWVLVGVSQLLAHRCTCPSAYPLQRTWTKYWDIHRSTLQMTPTPISKVPGKQQQHEHLQSAHPLPLASLLPHR